MVARYYTSLDNQLVRCSLCPHECIIHEGKSGICRVRRNISGELIADTYQCLSAINLDPIEKKPLYHYFPGREILSLGSLGCNFKCDCCQNYHISQTGVQGFPRIVYRDIPEIISMAKENPNNIGIAYTYNEPSVWYEYMFDISCEANKHGMKNVMVSNGYLNPEPLENILQFMDAFNIDLKAFGNTIHRKFTGGDLDHVLETLKMIFMNKKHLEITCLIVPGINDQMDNFEKMVEWIAGNLDTEVPLHLSRYFPQYRMKDETTHYKLLVDMAMLARKILQYVYIGNITTGDFLDTHCPKCGELVIERRGYFVYARNINASGQCNFCSYNIVKA
jgi:pyruvate formate lyase activating enzyme